MIFLNYSKLHNIKICSSCGGDLNDIYQKKISDKTSELLKINSFNKLNKDVLSHICKFIEHKDHKVIYLYNSNMLSYANRNDRNECCVWKNQKRFCNDCFKNGIIKSLFIHEKRLPHKIWHIGYFTYKHNEIKNKDEYLKTLEKCYLPSIFHITLFRTSKPKIEDDCLIITEK